MRKKVVHEDPHWYVYNHDINRDEVVKYDVGPRLRRWMEELKLRDRPHSMPELHEELERAVSYMFWSKAEYEVEVKGLFGKESVKIDVADQLHLNWPAFIRYMVEALEWVIDRKVSTEYRRRDS